MRVGLQGWRPPEAHIVSLLPLRQSRKTQTPAKIHDTTGVSATGRPEASFVAKLLNRSVLSTLSGICGSTCLSLVWTRFRFLDDLGLLWPGQPGPSFRTSAVHIAGRELNFRPMTIRKAGGLANATVPQAVR